AKAATLWSMSIVPVCVCVDSYKPVIIVHGIFDGPQQFQNLSRFIKKVHPGTEVTVIDLYDDLLSLQPLWKQVPDFRQSFNSIMKNAPDGVHLLCFSQGMNLILSSYSTDTDYLQKVFHKTLKKNVHFICYNKLGQKVSICDYWNDPHQRLSYLRNNIFLPLLNGERPHTWRENFLQIEKLVLIGGPDDGVITPWQSSHFGFYDSSENVVEMQKQEFYLNDAFGLKTLDQRGDLVTCVHSGVKHTTWHSNFTVFRNCMEKWLT
uniref:palmitoyl-CoA hydrolase n=1 Tax=Pundamilia nyererei TaxID=303518 RepID=A0A3B4GVE0_9CICH